VGRDLGMGLQKEKWCGGGMVCIPLKVEFLEKAELKLVLYLCIL
jgi:hypothetical protein